MLLRKEYEDKIARDSEELFLAKALQNKS